MNVPILDETYMEQARLHRRWKIHAEVWRDQRLSRRLFSGSVAQDRDDYARGNLSIADLEWLAERRWHSERRA